MLFAIFTYESNSFITFQRESANCNKERNLAVFRTEEHKERSEAVNSINLLESKTVKKMTSLFEKAF